MPLSIKGGGEASSLMACHCQELGIAAQSFGAMMVAVKKEGTEPLISGGSILKWARGRSNVSNEECEELERRRVGDYGPRESPEGFRSTALLKTKSVRD
jgi:hypothetical protein